MRKMWHLNRLWEKHLFTVRELKGEGREGIASSRLSWEHAGGATQISTAPRVPTDHHESTASTAAEVTNKF